MMKRNETKENLRQQLDSLETLRTLLGEETFQEKRAELLARLEGIEQTPHPESRPKSDGPDDVEQIIQSRQVQIDADAFGNIIITGDNNQVTLSPDQAPAVLLRLYYKFLAAECSRLPLGLVNEEFTTPGSDRKITLQTIYTGMDVVSPPQVEHEEGQEKSAQRWYGLRLERGEGGDRTALMDAITQPDIRCLTLLGLPGSGKTTFVNYLTARLAMGERAELPAALQSGLPVRIVLRDTADHLPLDADEGAPEMLWSALSADIAKYLGRPAAALALPYLQRRLMLEGGIVFLDGLDEVPEAGERRKCLLDATLGWVTALPKCRFLLTARFYAYADPKWRLPDFKPVALAPFNETQVANFVRRWYDAVRFSQGWDASMAQDRAQELLDALEAHLYLGDMVSRPLLLTLMTTLHSHKRQMPEDRAELYEFSVGLLLTRWQVNRQKKDKTGKPFIEEGIEKVLGLGETRLREALEELALQTHRKQKESKTGRAEAEQRSPADIPLGDVLATFSRYAPHDMNPRELVKYLENRAGLLIGRGEGIFTFPHRSFQEYLAACRLANTEQNFADALRTLVYEDLEWWREVFLLGVGKKRFGGRGDAVDIINRLAPCGPNEIEALSDRHWQAAALAAEAALDLRLPEWAPGNDYYQTVLKRLRAWLVALIEGGHLAPRERLQAGDLLGGLGDPRPGVGVIILSPKAEGEAPRPIPDLDWAHIPAGAFTMGSADDDDQAYDDEKPRHTLELDEFWLARYPLTNAQFRPFVEGGGYQNPAYWTAEGWAWHEGAEPDWSPIENHDDKDFVGRYKEWIMSRTDRTRPHWWGDLKWGAATRPVVGVTWYESLAYCRWLEEQLVAISAEQLAGKRLSAVQRACWQGLAAGELHIALPSEAQWEKAARGPQAYCWAWGNQWQDDCANTDAAQLGETSPVGLFPSGENPYGLLDITGNTWEWTHSKWGRTDLVKPDYAYPYNPDDGRETLDGPDLRVVRGGSWDLTNWNARCAYRLRFLPSDFILNLGFRVSLSLAGSEC